MKAWSTVALLAAAALFAGCAGKGEVRDTRDSREPREVRAPVEADMARVAATRLELAGLYLGRGQHDVALEEVRRALAAKPELPEAFNLAGLIHAARGDAAQAEASFQRALQMAPRDGGTLHNYGWFLCQQRRWADAEAQFNAALAEPSYRDPVITLRAQGVCLARAGRWADAERSLARALQLDPSSPVTAYSLSEVLLHRGELERARFYIGRVNAQPEQTSAQSLWLAARIERRLGNVQALQDIGRKLQERYPESNEAALFERGRFDE